MATIDVKTPEGQYPIVIEAGCLRDLSRFDLSGAGQPVVVSNPIIAEHHARWFTEAPLNAMLATMPDGEQFKNMDTVVQLYGALIEAGVDRHSTVFALGGGVVGDTAGFVAATYMRGVRFVQVPTSLLSMVDSSVGGKVGVDLPQGKNLVGAFKQPDMVLIDPDVLATLPEDEWRNGMAEVLKHGLLADEGLLDPALHHRERAGELVTRAVQVKVDVVQRDPFEYGERAHLNLGHTFAHAIEQVTGYRWSHGAAVGFGLLAAVTLSHRLGLCDAALVDRVDDVLARAGLPRRTDGLDPDAIWAAMGTDKKWRGGRSRFVLLRGVSGPLIMEDVARSDVVDVLNNLR